MVISLEPSVAVAAFFHKFFEIRTLIEMAVRNSLIIKDDCFRK
jgi:hypothetical protein